MRERPGLEHLLQRAMDVRKRIAILFTYLLLLNECLLCLGTASARSTVTVSSTTSVTNTTDVRQVAQGVEHVSGMMKNFFTDITIFSPEKASLNLQTCSESPTTAIAIAAIVGGLGLAAYNYQKIWEYTKSAVKRIGSFIASVVYGVTDVTLSVISKLVSVLTLGVISLGYTPLMRNFCASVLEMLDRRISTAEFKTVLLQLTSMQRTGDIPILNSVLTQVVEEKELESVPGPLKEVSLNVEGSGPLKQEEAQELMKELQKMMDFYALPPNTRVIVHLHKAGASIDAKDIDIIRPVSVDGSAKADAAYQEAVDRVKQGAQYAVLKIVRQPPLQESIQAVSREVATIGISELTTPAIPWYILNEFIESSGRSADSQLMNRLKELSRKHPIQYQARCMFIFGKRDWTGHFFAISPTPTEIEQGFDDGFEVLYAALVHAYFPRDPKTLLPMDQQILRDKVEQVYQEYTQKITHPPSPIHLQLMDIFLELGQCFVRPGPQAATCNLASRIFEELTKSNWKAIKEAQAPRVALVSRVRPVREADQLDFLHATASNASIMLTALKSLSLSTLTVSRLGFPKGGVSAVLINELLEEESKGTPSYPAACITKGSTAAFFELKPEWKEAYTKAKHQEQEHFVRGLIYVYFRVHPDALPPFSILKLPLCDAFNSIMEAHCRGNSAPAVQAQ